MQLSEGVITIPILQTRKQKQKNKIAYSGSPGGETDPLSWPELSSAAILPELLLVRKASCSMNFKPLPSLHSLLKPFWTMDSLG